MKKQNKDVYSITKKEWGTFIDLSERERKGCYYDPAKLARTLGISIKDAELLNSHGKTYVFAETAAGKTMQLYHPSLSCNDLSISFSFPSPERIAEFKHQNWMDAPFAHLVGQTDNLNHFVC